MIKKIIPFVLGVIMSSNLAAQDNNVFAKHYLKVYELALKYNDPNTAINAIHNYLAEVNDIAYKDTLSIMYFGVKSYYSSLLLAEEVYKAVPENIKAMGRAAECYNELGDPKAATELYEKVVAKTKNPYHYYQLAICQYQLKRAGECEASAKIALADTSAKRIGVVFTSPDGVQQTIPVNAAAFNLLGVLKLDNKNYSGAKTDFQEALKLFPDFTGARQNLDLCDKNMKEASKNPVKTKGQ